MEKSYEVKEAPNASELRPKREVSEDTIRQLGRVAIKGTQTDRSHEIKEASNASELKQEREVSEENYDELDLQP
ncbi:hypothetical protein [Acidithrix ferrooxidans]|uniref:Uncharacterized protein n=1 Tax=Acidithrix ferrooxidans TaxID=1280514 RepID=A0A0D8HED5_9ACTN|nr:hypothetical protein [Acidithrix ferrooxidans]KJF16162.1 hypothetical protein AXFE_30100 [Acidithrix ferrooxidans]